MTGVVRQRMSVPTARMVTAPYGTAEVHEEASRMAQKLRKPRPDDRIARALENPKAYFDQARRRALREVSEEMTKERGVSPHRSVASRFALLHW